MAYWILNKKNNKPGLAGSIPKLSENTGIEERKLKNFFSHRKKIDFENEDYRIVKFPFISFRNNDIASKSIKNNFQKFLDKFK